MKTGIIDYDQLEANSRLFRPKLLIAGASAYSRLIDYPRMRAIADGNDSILLADMAHISGLVAARLIPSPFKYADVVTTTTHKSLRGPRGALIFYRKGPTKSLDKKTGEPKVYDLEDRINFAVFPGLQGGPHNHTIAALATALHQALSPSFRDYQIQVMANARALVEALQSRRYNIVSGGTDNHLALLNVKESRSIDGARVEKVLEAVNIVTNKNTVPGDTSAITPGGLRLGTPALTTRGCDEQDMVHVAEFLDRGVHLALDVQSRMEGKNTLKTFRECLLKNLDLVKPLKAEVIAFAQTLPTIGYELGEMKYLN